MKQYFLIIIGALLLVLPGCYYDVESELYPKNLNTSACDSTAVTYQTKVLPIIQANCYACHAGSAEGGGNILLEGYANLQKVASDGRLYRAVSHTGPSPMPKGGNKLSACDIETINRWIQIGIPNN
ncbi:hypothetical protein [Adhaeribacter soli]|uniref:Cytochrome c domain-containing protein n=1 Tax=Adhaeribacter soli TaxID=2607655 RepID=A0A5N1J2R5_9BACT|nr:hypothetical protein [Adhaeribacter soli]KAA9338922.1 hypothetical protein F0P94_09020 [Adhaeribacter soli]